MNIKKLFPERKLTRKKILNFLDKKMFYIVLTLCICILGATIFLTMGPDQNPKVKNNSQNVIPEDINKPASNIAGKASGKFTYDQNSGKAKNQGATAKPTADTKPTAGAKPTASGANKAQPTPKSNSKVDKAASGRNISSSKKIDMIMPVFGQVCVEYSKDKPIFSKTLEEWQTHKYIEIACEKGCAVKATADGYVCDIKNDPKYGITVVVDHSNGIKTVYGNLASSNMVATNQKVSTGDIIGCVGDTAVFESAEQPHLHFEVLKNDEPVNPVSYLPKE
ncbi:MAG: M23 family metallopeptidase [Bacillota bacterium]|nr:M23 family metallopeptidase [Bacillota bacterium]